jgi:tRNA pseudouridine38-40 synthase
VHHRDDASGCRRRLIRARGPATDHAHGVLLTVAYDGEPYSGWAEQANARAVAGEVRRAIAAVDPGAGRLRAASRTDAGVHAEGQLVAFDTGREISARGWVHALNDGLPPSVAVSRAAVVEVGFDPRRFARNKRYRYTVLRSPVRDPFWEGRAWRVGYRLNHAVLEAEADALVGTHDFHAFRSAADSREHTVRTIRRSEVRSASSDPRRLTVIVEGDGFLHNMVRIIVGTLIDVGRGRLAPGTIARALAGGNRAMLGMTAPAAGLCLERVDLDADPCSWWPPGAGEIDWPGTVA